MLAPREGSGSKMTAFVVWPLGPDRGGGAFLTFGVWDSLNRDWVAVQVGAATAWVWDSLNRDWVAVQVGAATAWEKDFPGWISRLDLRGGGISTLRRLYCSRWRGPWLRATCTFPVISWVCHHSWRKLVVRLWACHGCPPPQLAQVGGSSLGLGQSPDGCPPPHETHFRRAVHLDCACPYR
ncbi:hypothetical protein QE152_g22297 [Popillia japonica]|uniref:Uncharacterized protein n=1 Tax=Popillia japonica TaxID=7064 RepID=A0AAW1KLF4_POPJA